MPALAIDLIPAFEYLANVPVAEYVRTATWAYPILEIIHVLGLGLLFGGIVLFDLRLLGVNTALPLTTFADHILPWVWTGFALNITSGVLLFLSDAVTFGPNIAFQVKMALILLAGLNALWFQRRLFPAMQTAVGTSQAAASPAVKLAAAFSLVLWICVIIAGRLIAYL